MELPKRLERKRRAEKIFEEIMAPKFDEKLKSTDLEGMNPLELLPAMCTYT